MPRHHYQPIPTRANPDRIPTPYIRITTTTVFGAALVLGGLAAIASVMWRMALMWREQHRYASFHDHQGAPLQVEGDVSLQKLESGKRMRKKTRGGVAATSSLCSSAAGGKGSGSGGTGGGGILSTEAVTEVGMEAKEAEEEVIALPDLEGQGSGVVVGVCSGGVSIR